MSQVGTKRPFEADHENTDVKRHRFQGGQTRVVFVRGLPADCLESELLALCYPFAVVEKSLMIPQKCQAFIQLPDASAAQTLVAFYQSKDATIRGKKIFFEYSNRDEITIKPHFDQSRHYQPFQSTPPIQQDRPPEVYPPEDFHHRGGNVGAANTILMVSVSNIEYDVTVDVLQQVFQKFGNVQKVVTFWKNDEFKSLVQLESVEQAQAAQAALDGRDIYTGCNKLSIVFSKHDELRVRFNNERSFDFTNPTLPPGPDADPNMYDPAAPIMGGPPPPEHRLSDRDRRDRRGSPVRDRRDRLDDRRPREGGREDRMVQGGIDLRTGLPVHPTGSGRMVDTAPSPVLICSGIDRALIGPDRLFTFFGCFGDVVRVKIMFKKRDTALIQFVDERHSATALRFLDGVHLFGKKLRVDYSKHTDVSMPRGNVDRFELENTRDYSGSSLHRYRRRGTEEAVPPCPLLHVSGIPAQLQHDQRALVDLFAEHGFVQNFSFLHKNARMALVEMTTLDDAVHALLAVDNLSFPDSSIRVSFSKAYQYYPDHMPGSNGPPPQGRGRDSRAPVVRDRARPRDRSRERERDRGRDRPRDRMGVRDQSRDRMGVRDRSRDRVRDRRNSRDMTDRRPVRR